MDTPCRVGRVFTRPAAVAVAVGLVKDSTHPAELAENQVFHPWDCHAMKNLIHLPRKEVAEVVESWSDLRPERRKPIVFLRERNVLQRVPED